MTKYFLCSLMLMLGCSSTEHTVWIDNEFSPDEVRVIYRSLDEWEKMPGVSFPERRLVGHDVRKKWRIDETIINIQKTRSDECDRADGVGAVTRHSPDGSSLICIWDMQYFHWGVLHEVGHAIGLGHDPAREGIMYYMVADEHDGMLTKHDREWYCKEWGC